jgi:hypothetical protein
MRPRHRWLLPLGLAAAVSLLAYCGQYRDPAPQALQERQEALADAKSVLPGNAGFAHHLEVARALRDLRAEARRRRLPLTEGEEKELALRLIYAARQARTRHEKAAVRDLLLEALGD